MPRKKSTEMSPAEWKVMRVVWEIGSGSSREIYKIACEKHGWAPGTVKKLLSRLVDKGFVHVREVGNAYLYKPARRPLHSMYRLADFVLENAMQGTMGPVIAYLVQKSDLSPEEIAKVQSILEDQYNPKE